jgi:arabinose-5-phosphate isomerase
MAKRAAKAFSHVSADPVAIGRQVIGAEISALLQAQKRLGPAFAKAVRLVLNCRGNVVLSGIGKPLFIAQKISASLASTGTPSIAAHPVDALHGDLGRVRDGDVIIALSNSGTTAEIVDFVRAIPQAEVKRIAITCNGQSRLAQLCDVVLDLGALEEASPMGVAPTTTSVAMLAVGDALTLAVAQLRGFTLEAFAKLHPAGALGRRFLAVEAAMRPLAMTAAVRSEQSVLDVLQEITRKRSGAACVVDEHGLLVGIFTDGDLRRLLTSNHSSLSDPIRAHMIGSPKRVARGTSVENALALLRAHHIDELPVVDEDGVLLGHLDIQDLA